jgi:hypothetical protein
VNILQQRKESYDKIGALSWPVHDFWPSKKLQANLTVTYLSNT